MSKASFHFLPTRLNKSLRILISVNAMLVFVVGLIGPFYAIYVQKIGGGISFAGFSWGLFSIVTGILTLLFSRWGLKVKEQELLIALGYILRAAVFLSYAFMDSMAELILTQILWGVAVALGTPAFDATYTAHTTAGECMFEWGNWEGIAAIASGVAAIAGGFMIQFFGFQPLFFIMSGIMALLGIYIWTLPRSLL